MRPFRYLAVASALVLFAAGPALCQTSTVSDPQAVSLATKALAALTGGQPISDVTLTGTATRTAGSDVETGTITLQAMGYADSRMDFAGSAGNRSEIRNSSAGVPQGTWMGPDGVSHGMASHNCRTDAVWFFPALSILSQASRSNVIASYVGQETRNGSSVQHLRFVPQVAATQGAVIASLSVEDIYLDSASLRPTAVLFNTHPDKDATENILVEIDFSNYQIVNGVAVPFRIQELINNGLFLDITAQSATFNSGLPQSTFSGQ